MGSVWDGGSGLGVIFGWIWDGNGDGNWGSLPSAIKLPLPSLSPGIFPGIFNIRSSRILSMYSLVSTVASMHIQGQSTHIRHISGGRKS